MRIVSRGNAARPINWAFALSKIAAGAVALLVVTSSPGGAQDSTGAQRADPKIGTIRVPAYDLPVSSFLSPEGRAGVIRLQREKENIPEGCSHGLRAREAI